MILMIPIVPVQVSLNWYFRLFRRKLINVVNALN